MTGWKSSYLLARLIPTTISTGIVLVTNALWPGFAFGWIAACLAIGIFNARGWCWRLRARPATASELQVLRAASGLVPGLRGRAEPRWWIARHPNRPAVWLCSPHEALASSTMVEALRDGRVSPDGFAVALAGAWGRLPVTRSVWVNVIDTASLPARCLAMLVPRQLRRFGTGYLMWCAVLAVIASVQQAGSGRGATALLLAVLAASLVLGPRWSAGWQTTWRRLADGAIGSAGLGEKSRGYGVALNG